MSIFPLQPRVGNFVRSPINLRLKFIRNALTQLNTFPYLKMSFTGTFKSVEAQTTK